MKARHIRKLRKKISQPDYYRKRYEEILGMLKGWNRFLSFECSSFFVGSTCAAYNKEVYRYNTSRLEKKARWYKERCSIKYKCNYPI